MKFALIVVLAGILISASSAATADVIRPASPRACNIPANAVPVRTVDQLKAELAKKVPQDIALEPGTYAPSTVLQPAAPHRLWGAHANDVTIRAGFSFVGAGNPGFSVRCITLNVTNSNLVDKRNGPALIRAWSNWTNITVADSRLLGNLKIGRAILAQVSTGLTVERSEIRGFHMDGIRVQKGAGSAVLRDLNIADIYLPGPDHRNGTAEFGIMVDTPATIERVRVRNAYWAGVTTYDADIVIRDLDVDGSKSGVYLEHYTHRLVLEDFRIGPNVQRGVNFEWDDPQRYSGAPTTVDAMIQDGVIEAYRIGAAVMDGQRNPTIRRVTFRNQCAAAIVGNRPRSTGEVYVDNDYSGIDPGAREITSKHPNALVKCGGTVSV